MKTKIEIKHDLTGDVLFEFEKENNTLRDTVIEAIRCFANLSFADLRSADLRYANLRYANLRSANLSFANGLDIWWHVHHEILWELLTGRVANRINFIKTDKPEYEVETRLRLLRPVLGKIPKTDKGWERLHKQECKKCPWNGKTIFPK